MSASDPPPPSSPTPPDHGVTFPEALRVWTRIGLESFGGPAGQIAVMHRELVERRRWIGEARFLHALNYCMLLPGPEAMQLATYVGWLLHGTRGGLAAGLLFVLPGFLCMMVLSVLYATLGNLSFVAGLFFGLKAAVLTVVIEALIRIGRRALKTRLAYVVAAAAFVGIFVFHAPFPAIVLGAGVLGMLVNRFVPEWLEPKGGNAGGAKSAAKDGKAASNAGNEEAPTAVDRLFAAGTPDHVRATPARAIGVLATWLAIWFAPVIAAAALFGTGHVFVAEGIFFSKAATVTFGGAYAVLGYVAQQAVAVHGWMAPGEMLDGLGLAETTPGPLILVVQFVGFLGAYRNAGALDPIVAGLLGATMVVWVTFAPCFLWIFLGAPWIEALRSNRALAAALSCITAAVTGVVLNLSAWFAIHVLFAKVDEARWGVARVPSPDLATLDGAAFFLAALAAAVTFRFHWGMMRTLALCAGLGAAWRLLV